MTAQRTLCPGKPHRKHDDMAAPCPRDIPVERVPVAELLLQIEEMDAELGTSEPTYLADPEITRSVLAADIKPGQVIAYLDRPRALVLRVNEPYTQRLPGVLGTREIRAHWCRSLDGSGREGPAPFGPGGQFPVLNTDGGTR